MPIGISQHLVSRNDGIMAHDRRAFQVRFWCFFRRGTHLCRAKLLELVGSPSIYEGLIGPLGVPLNWLYLKGLLSYTKKPTLQ